MTQQESLSFRSEQGHVTVTGALDREHAGDAWAQRRSWLGDSGDVTVDLAGVSKVDSAGLALLIQLRGELARENRGFLLRNVNQQLRQFAVLSGVTELFALSEPSTEA